MFRLSRIVTSGLFVAFLAGCGQAGRQNGSDLCDSGFINAYNEMISVVTAASDEQSLTLARGKVVELKSKYANLSCRAELKQVPTASPPWTAPSFHSKGVETRVDVNTKTDEIIAQIDQAMAMRKNGCSDTLLAEYKSVQQKLKTMVRTESLEDAFLAREEAQAFAKKYAGVQCEAFISTAGSTPEKKLFVANTEIATLLQVFSDGWLPPKCSDDFIKDYAALKKEATTLRNRQKGAPSLCGSGFPAKKVWMAPD